jgi:hypothetical protein
MYLLQTIFLLGFAREVFTNNTKVITVKATKTYECPPLEPDATDCQSKYDLAEAAVTKDPDYDPAAAITAVNNFIDACSSTKCQTGCSAQASNAALTTANSDFATPCLPATSDLTADITSLCVDGVVNVETECEAAYTAVIKATSTSKVAPVVEWVPATIKTSIATFSAKCTKTACTATCKGVISAKNVLNEYTNLKTNFTRDCNPNPPQPPPAGDGDSHIFINGKLCFILIFIASIFI